MNEQSMAYLEAIVTQGNISRAAKALYISQPYLSKFVKTLETELGVELIDREQSPMQLTYAGERYLASMQRIHQVYKEMEHEMMAINELKKGRLRIGSNSILGGYMLYGVLPKFMERYPGIEIQLVEERVNELEKQIVEGELDLAFNMLPIQNTQIDYVEIDTSPIYLVVPKGHALYNPQLSEIGSSPFTASQLAHEKFILLKQGLGLRRLTDLFFADLKIRPQAMLETENIESGYRISSSTKTLTIIPQMILENNQSIEANFYDIHLSNSVVLMYNKYQALSEVSREFIALAKRK